MVLLGLPCYLREKPPLAASNEHILGRKCFPAAEGTKNKRKHGYNTSCEIVR